jgi:hypothetical protein
MPSCPQCSKPIGARGTRKHLPGCPETKRHEEAVAMMGREVQDYRGAVREAARRNLTIINVGGRIVGRDEMCWRLWEIGKLPIGEAGPIKVEALCLLGELLLPAELARAEVQALVEDPDTSIQELWRAWRKLSDITGEELDLPWAMAEQIAEQKKKRGN